MSFELNLYSDLILSLMDFAVTIFNNMFVHYFAVSSVSYGREFGTKFSLDNTFRKCIEAYALHRTKLVSVEPASILYALISWYSFITLELLHTVPYWGRALVFLLVRRCDT